MSASLATLVKTQREKLGLKQSDLPGLSQSFVSGIESSAKTDIGREALGKLSSALGLSADELVTGTASAVRSIMLKELEADPKNPRSLQAGDAIDAAFIQSIKDVGLIQPLAVRKGEGTTPWMVVDGHRRYAALVTLHGPRSKVIVPCRIVEGDAQQVLLMQLVANVQRADMNPWDLARAIGDLVAAETDTQAIADALGKKRRWVQEMASVAKHLTDNGQAALSNGAISISQAVALAAERAEEAQDQLTARAMKENLGEDDIRAITADRKVKEKEATASEQVDIEDLLPATKKNAVSNSKWKHKRGHIEIVVSELGKHEFAAVYDYTWRGIGGAGRDPDGKKPRKTAAVAFLVAVRHAFQALCVATVAHPEDIAPVREMHQWALDCLQKLGGTKSDAADWITNNAPPEKPQAVKAAPKKADPKKPKIDTTEPPEWARPMGGALFMYHDGCNAWLCKGWRHMVKTLQDLGEDEEHDVIEQLYDRDNWASNDEGEPYDFGSSVVRLRDAPK